MKLPKFSQLGSVHGIDPCEEYRGTWIVYSAGKEVASFVNDSSSPDNPQSLALKRARDEKAEKPWLKVTVNWEASDNDPRIGKVWFTGFYRHTEV